ncbi:hypothetical protein BDP55DRAFT_319905 [Colletotrichum godetiae]|uniref:Transmembrane protein n=1 Tax=Colletotrichum godetiae TaxID=1209918 RepID=A0AAJ0EQ24_9PEZI|nr:uncharacterized protein BDP55DRAFT_319905 [Colletotrichum godetiae]KAK1671137.1 hypothetical protein BDP55DRAFT_319905 [Colletotrichum godetiae]
MKMGNEGDPGVQVGYASAPHSQWRATGTNGSRFPPPLPTAQSWTGHNHNKEKTWNSAGTFSLFKTLGNSKNSASTSSRPPVRSRVWPVSSPGWFKPENGGTVIFAGHVVLIIFEAIAVVISSQSLERVKKFPSLVLRAELACLLSLISMCAEVGIWIMTTLAACSYVGMALSAACAALLCLNATATGSYLIFAMRANSDKALCDEYGKNSAECWAGLRMGMAVGVLRVLLLPVGVVIVTGYFMRRRSKKNKR